jgi:hypothetical protein
MESIGYNVVSKKGCCLCWGVVEVDVLQGVASKPPRA